MKIKVFLLAAFWAMMLASCKEVSFREPQPAGVQSLKEVPKALIGKYVPTNPDSGEKVDTLIIESWGYRFTDTDDKEWLGRGVISDSLVLKSYEGYYFVNLRIKDQWVLYLLKSKGNGDVDFYTIKVDDAMRDKLAKRFKLTEIKYGDDTFYQINPTRAQLMALVRDGYFTVTSLSRKQK